MGLNKKFLLFALLVTVIFLFKNGYLFNQSDQEEHLPQIYQLLNPELYPNDFFITSYHKTFTVRESYILFVGTLAKIVPLNILCFILQIVCTTLSAFGLMKITQRFGGSGIAPFATVLLAYLIFNSWTVGGNAFDSNILISTSLANPFVVFSILFFLQGKNFLAGSFAGIATLFQILMGLHLFMLLLFTLIIIAQRKHVKKLIWLVLGYFVFSAAMLVPVLIRQSGGDIANEDAYYNILYKIRNYLHYVPSMFPSVAYLKFGLLIVAAYFVSRWVFLKKRKFLHAFSIGILVGMIAFYIIFELLGIQPLGKLQWFKTTVLLNLMCCIVFGLGIGNLLNNTVKPYKLSRLITPVTVFLIVVFSIPIFFSSKMPIDRLKYRYKIALYPKSDLEQLHHYISTNTPVESVILTIPNDDSYLCESKRSTPVSYKAVIHEAFYLLEWYDRMQTLYQVSLENGKDLVNSATVSYHNSMYYDPQNPYKVSLRIIDMQKCRYISKLQEPLYISGQFGLYPYEPVIQ